MPGFFLRTKLQATASGSRGQVHIGGPGRPIPLLEPAQKRTKCRLSHSTCSQDRPAVGGGELACASRDPDVWLVDGRRPVPGVVRTQRAVFSTERGEAASWFHVE